ncbi:hypothetical protein F0562_018320 [Nyssa sinensis]|uniref:Uncharacterized protein n=1 Tax=Nyssa sinensis TaxID=561372 RepID=A0A5J4ZBK0_9ASTE|nr:hypothetical protein F0562_018320 [Nyssa sinensis]
MSFLIFTMIFCSYSACYTHLCDLLEALNLQFAIAGEVVHPSTTSPKSESSDFCYGYELQEQFIYRRGEDYWIRGYSRDQSFEFMPRFNADFSYGRCKQVLDSAFSILQSLGIQLIAIQ